MCKTLNQVAQMQKEAKKQRKRHKRREEDESAEQSLKCGSGSDLATVTMSVNGFVCLAGLRLVLGVCQAHSLCERAQ